MSETTKSADQDTLIRVRQRMTAARANGFPISIMAKRVGSGAPTLHSILGGSRGASVGMVEKIEAAIGAFESEQVKVEPTKRLGRSDPVTLTALRERIEQAKKANFTIPAIAAKCGLGTTNLPHIYHFMQGEVGLGPDRVKLINRALDELGVPSSKAPLALPAGPTKPPHPARPYLRGHATPRLDRTLMSELAALARDSVVHRHLCTTEEIRRATHDMTHQGLVTFWGEGGRNTISPERAHAMLTFLAARGARGAKTLLARLTATGLVGTSTPLVAPGRSPRAPDGATVQIRERLRTALAERFNGELPALARQIGTTAAKTAKILGGFSNLSARDAERISERLDRLTTKPVQLALAGLPRIAATATDDPIARLATTTPAMNGAAGAEAARMIERWKDEAFRFFLSFASGRLPTD